MEEKKNPFTIGLSIAYIISTYQYAKYNGSIPIIAWLPEIIYEHFIMLGITLGFPAFNLLLFGIIDRIRPGGWAVAFLVGIFNAAWFWFLFSIKK